MTKTPELPGLLAHLLTDLRDVNVLWQIGILALCITGGWLVQRRLERGLLASDSSNSDATLKLHMGSLRRLAFPLTVLVLVLMGRAILQYWHPVSLLDVAVPLLYALALVRITIYMLRHVLAPSDWLRNSERYISWVIWIGFALYIGGLWPALRGILNDIGFSTGLGRQQRISLLLILQGLLSVGFTVLLALWLGRVIETRMMLASALNVSLRVMLTKLARALLLLAAILIALPLVGIDLTVLSVFGGMLGVGIGLGLQKIASNYISGFIILMDRSVSLGDLVTIDQHTGQLTKMTARYVVVRSLSGVEAIIPNDTLITSTVVNHSYTDKRVRQTIPVQVGYDCDLEQAMRIMVEAAQRQTRVLTDPPPKALITRFGDSGVDLELGFWVDDPQAGTGGLRSDLHLDIWREFGKHHIEIPYPQRTVRLSGAPDFPPDRRN